MARKYSFPSLLLLVLCAAGCADDPAAAATTPADQTAGTVTAAPSTTKPNAAAGAAASGQAKAGSGAATSNTAGAKATSAGNMNTTNSTSGATAGVMAAGPAAGSGNAAQGGSAAPDADAGAMAPAMQPAAAGMGAAGDTAVAGAAGGASAPIPDPVAKEVVWGVGLGVSDVAAATKFYTEVMKMTVEKENVMREDRVETVLASTKAGRGSRLVLMKFNDNREVRKISAKLVWQAPSPSAINAAAAMHPDYVSRLNIGIVQFDGPDTYIQEVGSSFDSGGTGIMDPYMVAIGFSVSDMTKSLSFFEMALGMEQSPLGTFTVTDATGTGSITEYTLVLPGGGGSAVIPQAWTPMRNSKDNPLKVVLFVPDAQAMADKVMANGGTIVAPAARTAVYDNRLLIVTKDSDGYIFEIVQ